METNPAIKLKERVRPTGTVTVRSHPAGTIDEWKRLMGAGKVDDAKALLMRGKTEVVQKNLVVDSSGYGLDILVNYLLSGFVGSPLFPIGIEWGEIGTGNTAPTNADTALTAPTNRATVSYAADNGFNTAQIQFFFPDPILANTTYYEFGMFFGGTSTIGSGNMFNHALFASPYSKSAGTDSTVECDVSF